MDCKYVKSRLSAFLDDELGISERANLETHLATCSACREEQAALVKVRDLLEEDEGLVLEPNFTWKMLNRLRAELQPRPLLHRLDEIFARVPPIALSVLAMLIIAMIMLLGLKLLSKGKLAALNSKIQQMVRISTQLPQKYMKLEANLKQLLRPENKPKPRPRRGSLNHTQTIVFHFSGGDNPDEMCQSS